MNPAKPKRKAVVLIVDGMGDLPVPELHGKTPLEAAFTPNLDRLASAGLYGQIDPIAPGVIPNTDSGTGMLMGMQPEHAELLRRGPVEAAGAGAKLRNGDIALRVNFASVDEVDGQILVRDRRAGRIEQDVPKLLEVLAQIPVPDGLELQLRPTDQHRAVLVFSGTGLDAAITDTDPGDDVLPAPLLRSRALRTEADHTADLLNRYLDQVRALLQDHDLNQQRVQQGKLPANALITRGAGAAIDIGNLITRSGMSAAVVAGCNTVRGLGRLFEFESIRDPRFTAKRNTDIDAKIEAAIRALQGHDMVFVHFKAPDLCAHDQEPLAKMEILQRFDAALAPLLEQAVVIACAADHSTDSNTGKHTADPVPSLLYTPDRDLSVNGVKFGESACRAGNMERQNSGAFLRRVLQQMQLT
ncbi:MAG TPA: 2,3-bisphosphoglycerate-independent phosphoglycerate mutase [Xanthomonadales bacterium]|nr:2,3-bisphosphoglycerate-independent phosphoglycerate mutase [Xanthomonadales bacterium]